MDACGDIELLATTCACVCPAPLTLHLKLGGVIVVAAESGASEGGQQCHESMTMRRALCPPSTIPSQLSVCIILDSIVSTDMRRVTSDRQPGVTCLMRDGLVQHVLAILRHEGHVQVDDAGATHVHPSGTASESEL